MERSLLCDQFEVVQELNDHLYGELLLVILYDVVLLVVVQYLLYLLGHVLDRWRVRLQVQNGCIFDELKLNQPVLNDNR